MSNLFIPDDPNRGQGTVRLSRWDEVRRLTDELQLKMHLASMDSRDRWRALEPRLAAFELRMKDAGKRASSAMTDELESLWSALRGIRDALVAPH